MAAAGRAFEQQGRGHGHAHDDAASQGGERARDGHPAVRARRHRLEGRDQARRCPGQDAQLGGERVAQTAREVSEHGRDSMSA